MLAGRAAPNLVMKHGTSRGWGAEGFLDHSWGWLSGQLSNSEPAVGSDPHPLVACTFADVGEATLILPHGSLILLCRSPSLLPALCFTMGFCTAPSGVWSCVSQ